MYVNDLILLRKSDVIINKDIRLMKDIIKMEDMVEVKYYLRVNVKRDQNKIELTQPQLMKQILQEVVLPENAKSVNMPAITTKHLNRWLH